MTSEKKIVEEKWMENNKFLSINFKIKEHFTSAKVMNHNETYLSNIFTRI